ncbi:glycosyltransferase family 4 protein [Thiorhodovibrio winogradskyi]|uniref:glycosyltransferase family 4 protein n=1 Tax=Thiorhodovibrio winogradskyi TaxID=77007 RepID=UPI002E2D6A56|nr:glycosyltransferase family 4 protein [Thiorhodovibrio winogradskyi]
MNTASGGYAYDRRIASGLAELGWKLEVRRLDDSFPNPSDCALEHARRTLAAIPEQAMVLIDGLALGAMPEPAREHGQRLRLVALVHHPLADETGLDPARQAELRHSEARALAWVRGIILTSEFTAQRLVRYQVPRERLRVVEPGVDQGFQRLGARTDPTDHVGKAPVSLLCVASLIERKGHDLLLQALSELRHLRWQLTCIGDVTRDPTWTARILALREDLGLGERVHLTGTLPAAEVEQYYRQANVAVLATRFEGYGMVIAEALAHGLPMVVTRGGAAAETLPDTAGLKVPVEDVAALRDALRTLILDSSLRARLAEGARRAALGLPNWRQSALAFAQALEHFGQHPAPLDAPTAPVEPAHA